ncbi:CheR family methyltransferase [Jatrophihabitans sp.]|uniref:CheR family methyltransferase n=1 Tax=Jatrophihabitans sp. TaxID=1932789 RepID=UPI002CCF3C82|nr:CheR family methyltransferase [Jatrophihabitans sp.]
MSETENPAPDSEEWDGDDDPDGPEPAELAEDPQFERLLQFLKESRSFDFTGYKRPSLMRRVRYRMRELGVQTFEDYQDMLQLDPDEFTALFNTILINVTSFFRDSEAWQTLREDLLPAILQASGSAPIRVWSAGCSAGQEAYSAAMLLHDLMGGDFRERVKIYATDVDEEALNQARQASYTEREIRGLPESYRERYFDLNSGRYVFTPDLRRSVIFGRNDLTRDAPISRIDVLLCRNTLMYFNAETQSRIVNRLAFALRPNGVLFLGKAEMLLNHASIFDPVDLKRRFFRRARSDVAEGAGFGSAGHAPIRAVLADNAAQLRNQIILTNPVAQIAVGADGRLAMINHRANGMLGLSDRDLGRPFQDLEVSYRPLELRTHLAAVAESRVPVWLREVEWWRGGGLDPVFVDVHIVPLTDHTGDVLGASISFTDVTRARHLRVEVEAANRQLETAYEELQSTNEELETTNEELQSTVEELETTNEELQSTNEELETMNEELQSANDELQITNEELRDRTLEISALNRFLQSILGSLEAAVIVLDRDLVVQVWTRQAHDLWGLRADETVGHHLLNLDSGLPTTALHPWLRSVITGQVPAVVGQRVQAVNRRGRTIDLRITVSALQGDEDAPAGALVLMEDVSDVDS